MQHLGTVPFETPRLICRRFTQTDHEDMYRYWAADPDIQYEYGEPVYETVGQVRELLGKYIESYESPGFYRWAVTLRSSNKNIGQIAFCKVYSDCRTAEI